MEITIEVAKVVSLFLICWFVPLNIARIIGKDGLDIGHFAFQAIGLTIFICLQWIY